MTDFVYQPPTEPWLDIVHRDRDIIVVNKPSGLLSVPGRLHCDSILSRLHAQEERCYAVHRIDMDTSGLQIEALRRAAERNLHQQFRERKVIKIYVALVEGRVAEREGHIDVPLRRQGGEPPRSMVDPISGKPAQTIFRVLHHFETQTLVLLKPQTGRSHQLRVHMRHLGHPIVGDRIYHPSPQAGARLMLHAHQLQFEHPYSQEMIRLSCLPHEADFRQYIQNQGPLNDD